MTTELHTADATPTGRVETFHVGDATSTAADIDTNFVQHHAALIIRWTIRHKPNPQQRAILQALRDWIDKALAL